jgi:hypothetical protein
VLIDDRVPPLSEPGRPLWEPDWAVWSRVLGALAAAVGSSLTGGLLAYALLCAAVALAAGACSRALPYWRGLGEHRQ